MNLFKKTFFIFFFLVLSLNFSDAEDRVSYIDADYLLTNTVAGKKLINTLKKQEELIINKFKSNDDNFKNEEKKILAKKNLISKEEINNELKLLQIEFEKYKKERIEEIDKLKNIRNINIENFLNLINPIIEEYMADNSIYMIIDKKNVFIANKDYDITNNLIELIDNQIKNIQIK
jgi:Skp family chaperone for outer membrane proteins